MIEQRVRKILQIEYEKRLLIYDTEDFASCFDYALMLMANDFTVYLYDDIERMRYVYESQIRNTDGPCAIIVTSDIYVPTDIRNDFFEVKLSLKSLYPQMSIPVLYEHIYDLDLIDRSYDDFERNCVRESETEYYIEKFSYSGNNVRGYIREQEYAIRLMISKGASYSDWIKIAMMNARLERYSCLHHIDRDQSFIDDAFKSFIDNGYQKLAGVVSKDAPVILPKVIDRIATGEKVALVVADGMSMFDFEILSEYMDGLDYSLGGSFAMIPTITSISRQALLAGKYPQQLENPFSLAKEESGFYAAAQERGYTKGQCFYGRGYDCEPGSMVKIAAVIINDIDDMVHGQRQGRMGMYNDVTLWAKQGKMQDLLLSLLNKGFKVYLTADHGNTHCVGKGNVKKLGVETETKSKRMVVLKDFADVSADLEERTFEYPGYYMDKSYRYRICNGRTSFDNKNEDVMTHGGIMLEEVIVPFVEVRKKNG